MSDHPGGQLTQAVEAAVTGADNRDQAVVELALAYARDIDAGGDLAKLGPALLAALEALHLSPRARKVVKLDDKPAANQLDQLSAARARRGRPQAVDTAAP